MWIWFLSCGSRCRSLMILMSLFCFFFPFAAANQKSCLSWVRSMTSLCSLHHSRRRRKMMMKMIMKMKMKSGHGGHQEGIWPRDTTGWLRTGRYDWLNQSDYWLLIKQMFDSGSDWFIAFSPTDRISPIRCCHAQLPLTKLWGNMNTKSTWVTAQPNLVLTQTQV